MNNPEHLSGDTDRRPPRHSADMHPAIARLDEADATADVRARWELGIARHGNPFVAFLTFEDIDPTAPDLLTTFGLVYYATFPDLRECADTFIGALGWQSSLDQVERSQPDIAGLLTWDYALIEERIRDVYEVVEYGGQIHLFDR